MEARTSYYLDEVCLSRLFNLDNHFGFFSKTAAHYFLRFVEFDGVWFYYEKRQTFASTSCVSRLRTSGHTTFGDEIWALMTVGGWKFSTILSEPSQIAAVVCQFVHFVHWKTLVQFSIGFEPMSNVKYFGNASTATNEMSMCVFVYFIFGTIRTAGSEPQTRCSKKKSVFSYSLSTLRLTTMQPSNVNG